MSGPDASAPTSGTRSLRPESLNRSEFAGLKSAACGSPPRRAYRPYRRCGRVAEGGGLLNRYRVVKPYRGFESLRLRHHRSRAIEADRQPHPIEGFLTTTPNAIVGPIHPKAIPVIPT